MALFAVLVTSHCESWLDTCESYVADGEVRFCNERETARKEVGGKKNRRSKDERRGGYKRMGR